jgi:Holliday junction resolvase RusA-like endonuclease
MDTETIYGQVISKANNYQVGNNRHGARYIIKSPEIRAYERSFCGQCKIYRDRLIDGRFTLFLAVYESSIRYDLDNALKTILDCLQMVRAIKDDNLCAKIVAEKHIDKGNPRIVFSIQEHEPKLI